MCAVLCVREKESTYTIFAHIQLLFLCAYNLCAQLAYAATSAHENVSHHTSWQSQNRWRGSSGNHPVLNGAVVAAVQAGTEYAATFRVPCCKSFAFVSGGAHPFIFRLVGQFSNTGDRTSAQVLSYECGRTRGNLLID